LRPWGYWAHRIGARHAASRMSRARSRSPLPADSLKISRTIAGFGRYASKRPDGLRVDRDGCMKLDDIMNSWGDRHGLRETDILHAVRRHMFREHEHGGSLRFAIDGDHDGGIVIRVMPKEDEDRVDRRRRHASPQNGVLFPAVGMRPPEKRIPKKIGSVTKAPVPTRPRPINATKTPALADKLSMSLDDLISTNEVIDLEADDTNEARQQRVRHSFRQMGLTPETMHLRRPPQDRDRHGEGRNGKGGDRPETRGRNRGGWSAAERMHRYISWIAKAGFKELGLQQQAGGWLELAGIAAAVTRNRKDLGDFDAEKLKMYIQETDVDGRFEINGCQLRKVDKADRRRRDSQRSPFEPSAPTGQAAVREPLEMLEVSSSASSGRHRRRSRSLSLGSDSDRLGADEEDDALAAKCQNLRVSGDMEDVKPEIKTELRPNRGTVQIPTPDPPPGEYWTQYKDEGDKGLFWWFYDGPLGQWWVGQDGGEPLQYCG